jgi:multimeric flavodoxin WrbA
MKLLSLLGSPKPKGNTASVLDVIEGEFKAQGHEVERINVAEKDVHGCIACLNCKNTADEAGCIFKDDMVGIIDRMIESDIILFASPIYFWSVTAQMKAVIDRSFSLYTNYHKPDHASLLKGKSIALLTTGGGVYDGNAELIGTAFKNFSKALIMKNAGELFVGSFSSPDKMAEEIRSRGTDFAMQLINNI